MEDTPQRDKIYAAYQVLHKQFHRFINSKYTDDYDFDSLMAEKSFLDHTGVTVNEFRELLLQPLMRSQKPLRITSYSIMQ